MTVVHVGNVRGFKGRRDRRFSAGAGEFLAASGLSDCFSTGMLEVATFEK